jgi:phage terminase large subunit-like protein
MNNNETIKAILDKAQNNLYWQLQKQKPLMSEKMYYRECARYAKHSFLCFIQVIRQQTFELRDFHYAIAAVLEHMAFLPALKYKRLILAAPPRSGKSTITQLFTAWLTGLNGQTSHIFASYGQKLSSKFMVKIHAIVSSDKFLECFPDFQGFKKGSKTELCSEGSFNSTSVGGAVTGFDAGSLQLPAEIEKMRASYVTDLNTALPGTPGLLTVDDPLKSGASQAELDALDDWWADEFNTRRTGNWMQMLIATRFSLNDLHGKLLRLDGYYDSVKNPEGWLFLNIQALACEGDVLGREPGEGLWEGHPTLNTKELVRLRAKRPDRFNCLYQGDPVADGSGRLLASDVRPAEKAPESFAFKSIAVDCASGLSPESDKTAVVLIGLDFQGRPWVLKAWSENLGFVELRTLIAGICLEYEPDQIAIEMASNGVALFQEMEKDPGRFNFQGDYIVGFSPRAYGNKRKRFESVLDLIRSCFWADDLDPNLLKELFAFPFGENDDYVDGVSWNLIGLRTELEQFEASASEAESSDWGELLRSSGGVKPSAEA